MNLKELEKLAEQNNESKVNQKPIFTKEELKRKGILENISLACIILFLISLIVGSIIGLLSLIIFSFIPLVIVFILSFILKGYQNKVVESIAETNKKVVDNKFTDSNIKVSKEIKFEGEKQHTISLILDTESKKIVFRESKKIFNMPTNNIYIVEFDNIIDCEILEDNSTIMKGGVGRAVVGGVLAGGVGAIVGSTTRKSSNIVSSLKLRVITSDVKNSLILLEFINEPLVRGSQLYKSTFETVQEMYALLVSITSKKETKETDTSIKQKLKDLKSMLDDNLITEKEYDTKKKELLKDM